MIPKRCKQAVGHRLLAAFRDAGAVEIAPDLLLPADTLLDLYGEDIRARAYVTDDPIRGEMMLRPDFTVPVVQTHMMLGAEPARYCYLGEVFRKQDPGDVRPDHPRDAEYLQAGFELFSRAPRADADVFALFHDLLQPYGLQAEMGDMGLLLDAVRGLPLPAPRCDALLHHIWRPGRFARLMKQFSAPVTAREFPRPGVPWVGQRTEADMTARMARLQADTQADPLPAIWAARIDALFALRASAPDALARLRTMAADWPQIAEAVGGIAARIDDMSDRGIDTRQMIFDASHGRTTLEYYDGFTFRFTDPGHPGWPPIASGGRYDALTQVLGKGRAIPAVGGIIRPGLIAEIEGHA